MESRVRRNARNSGRLASRNRRSVTTSVRLAREVFRVAAISVRHRRWPCGRAVPGGWPALLARPTPRAASAASLQACRLWRRDRPAVSLNCRRLASAGRPATPRRASALRVQIVWPVGRDVGYPGAAIVACCRRANRPSSIHTVRLLYPAIAAAFLFVCCEAASVHILALGRRVNRPPSIHTRWLL